MYILVIIINIIYNNINNLKYKILKYTGKLCIRYLVGVRFTMIYYLIEYTELVICKKKNDGREIV